MMRPIVIAAIALLLCGLATAIDYTKYNFGQDYPCSIAQPSSEGNVKFVDGSLLVCRSGLWVQFFEYENEMNQDPARQSSVAAFEDELAAAQARANERRGIPVPADTTDPTKTDLELKYDRMCSTLAVDLVTYESQPQAMAFLVTFTMPWCAWAEQEIIRQAANAQGGTK